MSPLLLVLGVGVLVIGSMAWRFSRARAILAHWAAQNRFEILEADYRWFFKGPYFFWSTDGQVVYYVTIRDHEGHTRHGYVRCGGWFLGLMSDAASVQWDE